MRKDVAGGGVRNVGGAIMSEDGEVCVRLQIFMKVFAVWEARNGGRKASRNLELRIATHAGECLESERLPAF
jgi:hypothetical protein